MKINIKKLVPEAEIPAKATGGAAAYDLHTPYYTRIPKGRSVIPLGFAIEIPEGYHVDIRPRSGFSSKGILDSESIRRDADVILGTIDSDYRGEVGAIIINRDDEFWIPRNTRIAQMLIAPNVEADLCVAKELSDTDRSAGGFGSTGA